MRFERTQADEDFTGRGKDGPYQESGSQFERPDIKLTHHMHAAHI
jgi:hypothetical protein